MKISKLRLSVFLNRLSYRHKSFSNKQNQSVLENGGLAQLGERLPCKQEVTGSIPVISTSFSEEKQKAFSEPNLRHGLIAQPVRAHA